MPVLIPAAPVEYVDTGGWGVADIPPYDELQYDALGVVVVSKLPPGRD